MSTGLRFIRRCAESQNGRTVFSRTPRSLFSAEEHRAYDFAAAYAARHSVFPSIEAFNANGISLDAYVSSQPAEALKELLETREAYECISTQDRTLRQAVESRDMRTVETSLRTMLSKVVRANSRGAAMDFRQAGTDALAMARQARAAPGLQGASLGFPYLDGKVLGVSPGELAFFVARPAVGKTWVAVKTALTNVAMGKKVLFVSLEMGTSQIARRVLSLITGIPSGDMRGGRMTAVEESRYRAALGEFADDRLLLETGQGCRTTGDLAKTIDAQSPDVVVMDAFYFLRSSGAAKASKWERLSEAIQETREVAADCGVPIIATTQFNRNQRPTGRGRSATMDLADIGGTDSYGQDAAVVVGIEPAPEPYSHNRRRFVIIKNREGGSGEFISAFTMEAPVGLHEVTDEDTEPQTVETDIIA